MVSCSGQLEVACLSVIQVYCLCLFAPLGCQLVRVVPWSAPERLAGWGVVAPALSSVSDSHVRDMCDS